MNKEDLVTEISETTELSLEDSEQALTAFANVLENELKEGDIIQMIRIGEVAPLNELKEEEKL